MMKQEAVPNRLAKEKSLYLLQHAYNPVDWWPWCDEAFEAAKAEDKPVFLSVGYSTCHWCHVMERESFEDPGVAEALNRNFISIKVDREERPDIDSVYMNVTQLLTGSGGWPMSVFLDGDKRPFFAGTYFPKLDGRHGLGFLTLLGRLDELWRTDRRRLASASGEILSALTEADRNKEIDYGKTIQTGYRQLRQSFDPTYGGFGSAPKFPSPHNLMLLLRYYHAYREPEALAMVEKTLLSMYRGGIRDHVGGGFCRYSTDRKWLAPHFEKMLYDNALLAAAYSEAFLVTGNALYRRAAEEILQYVQRDLTTPEGAFCCAEDADSEGEEGKFYTFTKQEIVSLLGETDAERFCQAYDISEAGNFEGKNIPNLIEQENLSLIVDDSFFAGCLQKLFEYRQGRVRPLRDDKILTSWNGLMIYAMAYAGTALENPEYIHRAKRAADFILNTMTDGRGRLLTRYRDGEARFCGVAEDYAYLVMGLLELYQASFEGKYLKEAYRLNQILLDDFFEGGALYQTGQHAEALIARPRELYDGALPSYNSVSIGNFVNLAHLCDAPELLARAEEIVRFFGADLEASPFLFGFALCGMMQLDGASRQIVITGDRPEELIRTVNRSYQPFTTVCLACEELSQFVGFYKNFMVQQEAAAYLCEGAHCEAPILSADVLRERLSRPVPSRRHT